MESFSKTLRRKHAWLLQNLDVESGLLDWLYQEKILSQDQFENVLAEKTTINKIRYLLLHCLQRRSSEIYLRFVDWLKCNEQQDIAKELEKSFPTEDISDSQPQANEDVQDGLRQSQNNCIIGFVQNVQGKRRSKNGHYFLSFHLQTGPEDFDFERCLSFYPDLHGASLLSFQETRQPICIGKFTYMYPREGYNGPPAMMITEHSYVNGLIDEEEIDFNYKEMPIVYTPLDQLKIGEFINVRIKVISQGNVENRTVKRKREEEEFCNMDLQEKFVKDEKGNRAVLDAWGEFVYTISPEEGFMEIMNVYVREFQNAKHLSTNANTFKKVKA